MKKYILIYAYTFFSEEEIAFWNNVNECLAIKGYTLFLLAPVAPKQELLFEYSLFTEKLSNVKVQNIIDYRKLDNKIIDREETWYGKSNLDLSKAYFTQKNKYSKLLKELNPCFALIANGHHANELILIKELQKRQIDFSFFERGCITKTWHIDKEGITAGTRVAKLKLEDLNYTSQECFQLYSKEYFNSEDTWWAQPKNEWSLDKLYQRFEIENELPVILFANQLDNDTSNFLYSDLFDNNLEAFEWLVKNLKDINFECFIMIKKHPHFKGSKEEFEDVLKKYESKGVWVEDIPLKDCISFSNYICAVNSTMILDGFMMEKPTLTLGKSIYSNKNIFWEIESIFDNETLNSWLEAKGFQKRLENFRVFLSYMIEYELYFFSKVPSNLGFLNFESFSEKLISNVSVDRVGRFPKKYDSMQRKNFNVNEHGFIRRIIKRLKS